MESQLIQVRDLINAHFASIDSEAFSRFVSDFSFGKMLRSKLILSIAPHTPKTRQICAIIELIHFASLLHDDVIDSATMRRGKRSINATHGDKNAIMLGDILYSRAFFEVAKISQEFAKIISNAVFELSLGELDDVFLSQAMNLDAEKYITMIKRKTAALIEASAICGGILKAESAGDCADCQSAADSHAIAQKYGTYGQMLGIAFQIIDDLLDVTQDDSTLGKAAFSDFSEGKTTLPYIYLYRAMNEAERARLSGYFKQPLDAAQKAWIRENLAKYGIIESVKKIAQDYGNLAISALDSGDSVPKDSTRDSKYSADSALKKIAQTMIDREF